MDKQTLILVKDTEGKSMLIDSSKIESVSATSDDAFTIWDINGGSTDTITTPEQILELHNDALHNSRGL